MDLRIILKVIMLNLVFQLIKTILSAINEKLKALQKSSTTLKDIYAVVLGIDESALKLNANEPFATFDAIKKFAEEQLKTTALISDPRYVSISMIQKSNTNLTYPSKGTTNLVDS